MQVLIATNSFKGSLSSIQATNAINEAILSVNSSTNVVVQPMADGGSGTVDAIAQCLDVNMVSATVMGPLCEPVVAKYAIIKKTKTAVIEMSAVAGLSLLPKENQNPLYTTTFGVGELIIDAINRGCRDFIIGLGDSATNDGGVGMLSALGVEFLDKSGAPIAKGAIGLKDLHSISIDHMLPLVQKCSFRIACDITNPLCGDNGCSAVFALQKGAPLDSIPNMDLWLNNYANLVCKLNKHADPNFAGAGSAGGLGFAFLSFLNASLEQGFKIVSDIINLEDSIKKADIVVTGEGKIDHQTFMGKAPGQIINLAKKYNKQVIAFCGELDASLHGVENCYAISSMDSPIEDSTNSKIAYANLVHTATKVFASILK